MTVQKNLCLLAQVPRTQHGFITSITRYDFAKFCLSSYRPKVAFGEPLLRGSMLSVGCLRIVAGRLEMEDESLAAQQMAPIIALPHSFAGKLRDLRRKYGDRYRIVSSGYPLTGWKAPRILVLTETLADKYESIWHHDWVDYQLACRLLPEGRMIEIIWDPRVPGRIIFSPMRRKGR